MICSDGVDRPPGEVALGVAASGVGFLAGEAAVATAIVAAPVVVPLAVGFAATMAMAGALGWLVSQVTGENEGK